MSLRWRIFAVAFCVSLGAAILWRSHAYEARLRVEQKQAWQGYLRGPLSDLLYGSSRLRPLILKKSLKAAEKAEAKDAVEHLRRSSKDIQVAAMRHQDDSGLKVLADAVQWHQEIYDLLEPWPQLVGKKLGQEAVEVERDLRRQLWKVLASHRENVLKAQLFSPDEILEMNALLYSLQEK